MQTSPNLDTPLPRNSIALHRISKAVQFLDKQKPLGNGPFKIFNKPTVVTYELLTQD